MVCDITIHIDNIEALLDMNEESSKITYRDVPKAVMLLEVAKNKLLKLYEDGGGITK